MRRLLFSDYCDLRRGTMDLQLAHDIISICNEESGGATVEDCAEQLGITGARLADVFDTFEELVRSEKLMRIAGDRYISAKQPQEITGIYKGDVRLRPQPGFDRRRVYCRTEPPYGHEQR